MSLKNLGLKFKYRSDVDIIYKDFYEKCLDVSVKYDRAVGYFTSSSLKLIAKGLDKFINKGGKIRIIANPYITSEDMKSIVNGYKAKKDVIYLCLLKEIEICEKNIEDDTLNILAWLIYKDILDIKIAYTENDSIYHEKFGIFYDNYGNKVAFSGSSNETVGGIKNNFEKVDVYFKESEINRIEDAVLDFENLWNNNTKGLEVIDIPHEIKEKIVSKRYGTYHKKSKGSKKLIEIRDYQKIAMEMFKDNNYKGILEMATGTGKTITSLLIANDYKQDHGKIFLVILVPFTHLVGQWEENCNLFEFDNILRCYGAKSSWVNDLDYRVRDFNIGIKDTEVVVTTYKSASSQEFNDLISQIRGHAFLISDECHYFGINSLRDNKFSKIKARLGLSATPDRWWDEDGTDYLRSFFSDTIYEYSLEEAIKKGVLTEYNYNPIICDLNDEELAYYEKLTKRITYLMGSKDKSKKEEIEELNRKRSMILSRAKDKLEKLLDIFKNKDINNTSHTLIYCAPGQIDKITKEIADIGFRVHKFNSDVDLKNRSIILDAFNKGDIQILVAIKCLDEGVDIPSTKTAYFLASTSNPREFVQRRGRVLRKYSGKNIAEIYDFILLPTLANEGTFRSIVSKEMPRFAEFSKYAINQYIARSNIRDILSNYHLEYLMDKLPWEVHNEMKEEVIINGYK